MAATLIMLAACAQRSAPPTSTTTPGFGTAVEAVEGLHGFLVAGDFESAGRITVPGHAALATLAEGATAGQVAHALRNGPDGVAANFWAGFSQGAGEAFLGDVTTRDLGTVEESGEEFYVVEVLPTGLSGRRIITRDVSGHLIDLFASFGDGLAERMLGPVEGLIASTTPEAVVVLGELRDVAGSLLVASRSEGLSPETVQSILRLVELITRVG